MGFQDFIARQILNFKAKDMPAGQKEQLLTMFKKDPELMKKISEEIERRVKRGGENQTKASIEVMKKYRTELAAIMQK